MRTSSDTMMRSTRALSGLIGFCVLFAAVIAGGTLANAGREKLSDPTWLGEQRGVAMTGFLFGAKLKATKSEKNPYPDVLAPVQKLNTTFIGTHMNLIAWLIMLGEITVPIGALILLCVRFPGSRNAALIVVALATAMHVAYMLEGSSGDNTPLLLMWLTILWLLATVPAAALHFAIDLGALFGKRSREIAGVTDVSIGQWVFFGMVALVIASGGALLYGIPVLVAYLLATLALTGLLALGTKARLASRAEYAPQPAQ